MAAASYFAVLMGHDRLLMPAVILSGIGLVAALFAGKGRFKQVSILGNALIIFISVVVPFVVTTFLWTTP
ncbi:hypothetical protein [Bacillus salacetis]|uniref:hypothetical protein n=1 Tax=Bacillus salacetis TaxID=2315464 RepID=UPI001443FC90|nr:hypothetical protein [Bacillus salacetis]